MLFQIMAIIPCAKQYILGNNIVNQLCVLSHSVVSDCDPNGLRLPVSSVHGILQARILEWVAMPSPRGSSQPRD